MRVTRNPLWRRAPFVLSRFPGIAAALVGGAALLAVASAAGPLFVASAGSAALEQELDAVTPYGAGVYVRATDSVPGAESDFAPVAPSVDDRTATFAEAAGKIPGLGPTVVTVLGPGVDAANPERPRRTLGVRLLSRTDALEHLHVTAEGDGEGMWLAESTAGELGLEPGDDVLLGDQRVPVAGLYRQLFDEPATPYWRSLTNDIYPGPPVYTTPPTFAIGDRETILDLSKELGGLSADFRWEAPLAIEAPSLPDGRVIAQGVDEFERSLKTPGEQLNTEFRCSFCYGGNIEFTSQFPNAVRAATLTAATVRAPVDLLTAAGQLIALAVLAAVAVFSLERRRAEATLMNARGAGPGTISAIAALESLVPVLVGLVLGLGLAYAAISVLGPGGTVERAALDESVGHVILRAPVALVLIALVAGIAFAREYRMRHDGHRSPFLPWELVALALAGWFLYKLLHGDAVVVQSDGVERPSAYLLLFPILAIAGVAGLVARLFVRLARVWRNRTRRRSGPASYLAAHRLASARRLLLVLVTACAVAFGLFIYAQVVVTSYRATIDAAALLGLGSDVRGLTSFDREAPADREIPTTKVTRIQSGGSTLLDRVPTYLLAVDTATFERAVHWDSAYADEPLADILAKLDEGGSTVPVLVVQGNRNAEQLTVDSVDIPFRVVATAKAFPGMAKEGPLVVASEDALEAEFDRQGVGSPLAASSASTQILAKGEPGPALKLLESSPARPYPIVTAQELARRPSVTAFTRTFSFLQALGLVAGLLGLVGLVVYMQARARTRALSYGFAHRMGLSARSHRRALLLELGLALSLAFVLAVSLAALAARLVLTRVEPLASISPVPLVKLPGLVFAGVAVVLALVTIVGAVAAHRSAARANLAEVLRLGE